jgi:molybdopterin-guanine dinucleotide biosynthesis protein A
MPFVSPDLLRKTAGELKPGVRAVFCHSEGRAGFPLILRKDALLAVEELIEQQRFSLQELAKDLSAVVLPADEHQLFNVNTPKEMEQAKAWWNSRPPP